MSSYSVRISRSADIRKTLSDTACIYRKAVDFFIRVCMAEWAAVSACNGQNGKVNAMEVMPDHVHLLLDCKPQFLISDMVKILKGNTARWLFLDHPELKQSLRDGHLWNPSYCAVTVSDRSRSQVEQYIKEQKEK